MRVVILTGSHNISGGLQVSGKRLSDVLNDRHESMLHLEDASISRLARQDEPVERLAGVIVMKQEAVVAFEESTPRQERRLVAYAAKRHYDALLIARNLEVRGQIHASELRSSNDLHRLLAGMEGAFLPVTDATVILLGTEASAIERAAVLVNVRYVDAAGLRQVTTPGG
jgi:hypothetical protein